MGQTINKDGVEVVESPATKTDTTKIISERLAVMRNKDREELAKAMGYESWDSAMNSGMDKKLLDAGIDPEMGKPVINDLVENHPEVRRAREVLAEAEALKRNAGLELVNSRFGTTYTSLDDLDDATKGLINKGLSVDQAYAAIHYNDDQVKKPDSAVVSKLERETSLKHLNTIPGTGARANTDIALSAADIASVRRFMPNATEDQIKEFKQKNNL